MGSDRPICPVEARSPLRRRPAAGDGDPPRHAAPAMSKRPALSQKDRAGRFSLFMLILRRQQLLPPPTVISQSGQIRQHPPNGDGPPDGREAKGGDGGQQIGQRHPGAQ